MELGLEPRSLGSGVGLTQGRPPQARAPSPCPDYQTLTRTTAGMGGSGGGGKQFCKRHTCSRSLSPCNNCKRPPTSFPHSQPRNRKVKKPAQWGAWVLSEAAWHWGPCTYPPRCCSSHQKREKTLPQFPLKHILLTSAIASTTFCLSTCKIPFFAVRDTCRSCQRPRVRGSSLLLKEGNLSVG